MTAKAIRCAIYTRKSTEHGLELEFNSLDAQREACEAYIKSQASQGWRNLPQRYDDAAFSGGNMDRPALKRLLDDIDANKVDVIVVYKIDRLTRSLADFAKLVEIFDAKAISFVAVTQQFNTTTSMGRLTLNVLLSFAQFERELSSERVRDKVAASRKKGQWGGGSVPLGYDSKDKKLVINEDEAETVRAIFKNYLELRSLRELLGKMGKLGVVSKQRTLSDGRATGGVAFGNGSLAYLLKNRTYCGEIRHKCAWYAGEHPPIIDTATFDRVQELLRTNSVARVAKRSENKALLAGLLFDDRDNRMSPSFSTKRGIRYGFYVSAAILRGRKGDAGSLPRVSAPDLEDAVLGALRERALSDGPSPITPRNLIDANIARIQIGSNRITITLRDLESTPNSSEVVLDDYAPTSANPLPFIEIPWSQTKKRNLAPMENAQDNANRDSNPGLVQAVVRAHAWVKDLSAGTHESIEALAKANALHPKVIRNGIRLAFLAPDMTNAILQGEQPASLTLRDFYKAAPLCWSEQRQALGFLSA
jgi:DNA invertase Pin-like site-specific DNA recombinase